MPTLSTVNQPAQTVVLGGYLYKIPAFHIDYGGYNQPYNLSFTPFISPLNEIQSDTRPSNTTGYQNIQNHDTGYFCRYAYKFYRAGYGWVNQGEPNGQLAVGTVIWGNGKPKVTAEQYRQYLISDFGGDFFTTIYDSGDLVHGGYQTGDTPPINIPAYDYDISVDKPNYHDLISGYSLDSRIIPQKIFLTKNTTVGFYRKNYLEPIPGLESLDWVEYEYIHSSNQNYIDTNGIVLGTMNLSDITALDSIFQSNNNEYSLEYLFQANLPALFAQWQALYQSSKQSGINYFPESNKFRLLAANNNIWNNNSQPNIDVNFDIIHPLFTVDNQRAYDWHISLQSDNSKGNLIMDSPRIIEIHAALEASKYKAEVAPVIGTGTAEYPQIPAIHTLAYSIVNGGGKKIDEIHKALEAQTYSQIPGSNNPRIVNLGHLINKIAFLLGYRPEPNGDFNKETEKGLVRKVITANQKIDPKKIGVNNFASDGMIVKRLNNRFDRNKIVNDECVIIRDFPQLLAEYQDQINLALGLQESSAFEITNNTETSRYSNQLSILSEILNLSTSNNDMVRAALISSLVTQGQTSETIAALGLPTVTKTIPIDVDGKINHLPYKGVAPHRSISQEVATCTQNVGMVLGQLL
jgi:hypothetical protein